MEVADATAETVFEARKRQREAAQHSPCAIGPAPTQQSAARVQLGFGDSSDEEEEEGVPHDTAIARALVRTISATTGVELPNGLKTTNEAVSWASSAILEARAAAITSARREKYNHILDPEQTIQAMHLIGKLNTLLSGPSAIMRV